MSCPTCDHTMQGIGYGMSHCPRCGTLVGCHADGSVTVPALVGRCRKFGDTLGPAWSALWHRLGIRESINKPEDRAGVTT